jgi:hypothetical protein
VVFFPIAELLFGRSVCLVDGVMSRKRDGT